MAIHGDVVAVALVGETGTLGRFVFHNPLGAVLGSVLVGSHPDMFVFTPDGQHVVVANEGEPPTAGFGSVTVPEGVRVFGPGASPERDLEPEYVAVAGDGPRAWATLQENNALALLDLELGTVEAAVPPGLKDHWVHGLDASNRNRGDPDSHMAYMGHVPVGCCGRFRRGWSHVPRDCQ